MSHTKSCQSTSKEIVPRGWLAHFLRCSWAQHHLNTRSFKKVQTFPFLTITSSNHPLIIVLISNPHLVTIRRLSFSEDEIIAAQALESLNPNNPPAILCQVYNLSLLSNEPLMKNYTRSDVHPNKGRFLTPQLCFPIAKLVIE